MSSVGPESRPAPAVPADWDRLELGVRRLLDELDSWRRRAVEAERRCAQLQQTLDEVASGGLDPQALNETLDALQAENRELRRRLDEARQRLSRVVGRLDFLAEEP